MLRLRPSSGDGGGRCGGNGAEGKGWGHSLLGDPPPSQHALDNDDHQCCDSATRLFFQFTVALMAMATTSSTVLRVNNLCPLSTGRRGLRRLSTLSSRWTRRLLLMLFFAFTQPLAQRHPRSRPSQAAAALTISSSSYPSSCPISSLTNRDTAVQSSGNGSSDRSGQRARHGSHHHRHYRRRCHHPFLLYHLHFSPYSSSSAIVVNLLLLIALCSSILICVEAAGSDGQAIHSNSQPQNSHLNKAASASISSSSFSSGQASDNSLSLPQPDIITSNSASDMTNYEAGDDPNAASSSAQRRPPLLAPSSSSSFSSSPSAALQTAGNSLVNNPAVMKEHVCGDIDIRNSVTQFYELENCTVVEGHVKIVLIDNGTAKDFANLTFPRLREITDYFLLFRIMGLQSLKRLFPNLAVIRGRTLLDNYALVIYEMLHLQEIGLTSLTDIVRGDVRIEKNPNLCFVDTIDWSRIARNSLIISNKASSACPSCNDSCPVVSVTRNDGTTIGDMTGRVCWTDEVCQKTVCPNKCETHANQTCSGGDCCPRECLGGCRWSTDLEAADFSPTHQLSPVSAPSISQQVCLTCRHFIYQNRCYRKCPSGTYEYFNRRCVTERQCYSLSSGEKGVYMKAFRNRCEATCPVGYMENVKDRHRCDHCGVECPKVCQSSVVSNIQSAQELKGCTIINGSLEIYISSGGAQIVKELEENLKDLSEITDFLKIARSYPLITLNFLRNLKVIHGNKLERQSFSLLVLDNPNLQDLWIFENVTTSEGKTEQVKRIRIPNGRPFFHINPKLCVNKIEKMREYVDFGSPGKWNENEVSPNTNGDKVPCAVDRLGLSLWGVGSEVVGLLFEDYKPKMDDSRTLLGYLIYYRESEHRNVSIFDGRDACSDNQWTVVEFDIDTDDGKATTDKMINSNSSPEMLTHIIPNLKPYTQYALYIKTYTLAIATRGAQSDIIYFKTKPSRPTPPRNLVANSKKYDEFELKWDLPARPNGEIDRYYIKVTRDMTSTVGSTSSHSRDHCLEKDHGIIRSDAKPAASSTTPSPSEAMFHKHTNGTSDAQQNFPWKNADGKQCCTCRATEKIRPMDVEQSINFEDFILNTVYVRRSKEVNMNGTGEANDDPGDAGNLRRRRNALNFEFLNDTPSNSSSTTFVDLSQFIFPTEVSYFSFSNDTSTNSSSALTSTTPSATTTTSFSNITSTTSSSNNSTSTISTPAPEETTYEKNVTKHFRRLATFTGLVHYTVYKIEMRACQDSAEFADEANSCSLTALTTVRTLPLIGADDVESRSVVYTFGNDSAELSNSLRLVHLRWDEPPKPNGEILSYNIQHMRVSSSSSSSSPNSDNKKPTIECISRASYLKNALLGGYKLELTPGNHSVQVRARSLFGPGAWTEELYIFVEEPSSSNSLLIFLIVILFLLAVIAFVALFAYKSYLKRMKIDYISVNPEYMSSSAYVYTPDPKWEVPRENVNLIRELGQGSFGMVYEGTMINDQKEMIRCAVKTVNDNSSNRVRFDFLKEADVMKSFTDSFHVVKLLGIVSKDAPVYVLMEIMPRGDLRKYLRENRPDNEENLDSKPPALEQLYKIAIEIADGMSYLASKKFVHRDLAARNCMVADDLTVKIGDFGMTRDIYETDYYRKGGKGLLPVRWMSPESLKDGIFTTYSDVWSYGVVLWEMATLASQPYQGLSNEEVLKFVVDGGRMTKPENCPDVLWQIMCKSWERKPKARPTFLKIVEMLLEHMDNADKPGFLAVSYYHQWKTSRTEKETAAASAAAASASAAAVPVEVASPSTEQLEIEADEGENDDDEEEEEEDDGAETVKDETLIPLRKMSRTKSSRQHESEEEGNSDYSTYEDDDDQLNEEDTNVHFFPLSRDVTSDVRLFNSPEEVPSVDEKEKEKKKASPAPSPSLKKGSKEPLTPSTEQKMTSSSPKTLNVKPDQKEKKSVSLIGLHELLPVRRSSSSRVAAGLLKPDEKGGEKLRPSTDSPSAVASSQKQLHSGSGGGNTPSNNNNGNSNNHHHLSANSLFSSASPLSPSPFPAPVNLFTSSYATSNVNFSPSFPGQVVDTSSPSSPRLATKKPVITLTASPLKPSPTLPPPSLLLPPVTVVTPTNTYTADTSNIDIEVDGEVVGAAGEVQIGGRNETPSTASAGTAASGRGLINGHLINTTTTTSMV